MQSGSSLLLSLDALLQEQKKVFSVPHPATTPTSFLYPGVWIHKHIHYFITCSESFFMDIRDCLRRREINLVRKVAAYTNGIV